MASGKSKSPVQGNSSYPTIKIQLKLNNIYKIWLVLNILSVSYPSPLSFKLLFPTLPLLLHISCIIWYFSPSPIFPTHPLPYFASFRPRAAFPSLSCCMCLIASHHFHNTIYTMECYSSKSSLCRHFGLGYLQKGNSVQSKSRGMHSVPEVEGISDKKQPQGQAFGRREIGKTS